MHILAFDTETTGLPAKNKGLEHQPHIMQLAFSLYDEDFRPVFELSTLVKLPEGVTPHPKALETHGITPEMCNTFGVEKKQALALLRYAVLRSDRVIAHNAEYDMALVGFDATRADVPHPVPASMILCTCDAATPIVNLPPTPAMIRAGFNKPKRASLAECWRYFFDEELSGAHDALVDTRGCARVYRHLVESGLIED